MTTPAELFAATLVDELARSGVRHAVISPGSRSAPLALALDDHPQLQTHVVLDERSAAFMALGIAKANGHPAVMVCTSGTAAANLAPAVHEAHQFRVPMIVITADRPPELRDTGANQTIDQIKMFGDAVRWFCEIGVPEGQGDGNDYWRSVASRAVRMSRWSPPGPVHLNAALREPLISDEKPQPGPGRADGTPWTTYHRVVAAPSTESLDVLSKAANAERGVVVAGAGSISDAAVRIAHHLGWPLLADPLSNCRTSGEAIAHYDLMLRDGYFAERMDCDVVIRTGRLGISKALDSFVAGAPVQILIDEDGASLDAHRSVTHIIGADPGAVADAIIENVRPRPADTWLEGWKKADALASEAIDRVTGSKVSEISVARTLAARLPQGARLFVGASMPFRDIGSFAPVQHGITFHGNRGANGIDGTIATAFGVAVASGDPTWVLCGDLTLLHDANALLAAPGSGIDLTIVAINNSGGGIFSFLPQASVDNFERLFATPQERDLEALAAFHRIPYRLVTSLGDLPGEPGGVRLMEIRTERAANLELHREIERRVAAAVSARRST